VGPLPPAKYKLHTDNALGAKNTASLFHNGKRGLHIHIIWLYNSSISQSYGDFTDFGVICSGIPRLKIAREALGLGLLLKSTCLSKAFSDQIKAPKKHQKAPKTKNNTGLTVNKSQ
jgi:hypothetical protein